MNIYLIMQNEQDYREIISTPISAHSTRECAAAEAARLDLEVAWASNQPDYDGGGLITHHVYEIPFTSTGVDIAPSASIGSVLWNRHDVGWWPDYIPLFDRGPVTEIPDARALLQDAGVESPIDGLVYCAAILKKPNCMMGVCIFGDTGYEFQIPTQHDQ